MSEESSRAEVRVLLVDDDEDQRLAVAALFARRGFDDVTQAASATQAIEQATALQPDLIVLDLAMPGRSGIDALPDLRLAAPDAAVVVLSNMPRLRLLEVVLQRGAMGFVEKAVPPGRLVDEILLAAALTDACRTHVLELPASDTAPSRGRHFARKLLGDADRALVADVELLVSELVTNAIAHAGSDPRLAIDVRRERIRVEVYDGDPNPPVERQARPTDPGGRGLRFVRELSSQWGYSPSGTGKVVWLDIDRTTHAKT